MEQNYKIVKLDKTLEEIYLIDDKSRQLLPLLATEVVAGFPSSAENFIEKTLDLNELLIQHPAATFYIRVRGDSMINAGISSNDILIVDRAITPTNNKIIIARLNDELTVKRISYQNNKIFLFSDNPENKAYKPIEITENIDFEVWGVVTCVIHRV